MGDAVSEYMLQVDVVYEMLVSRGYEMMLDNSKVWHVGDLR